MEPPEACSVLTSIPCTLCVLGQIAFPDKVCFLFYKTKPTVSLSTSTSLHPWPRCCERLRGLAVHAQRNRKIPAAVSGWVQQEHVHVVCSFHLKNVGHPSAFYWGTAAPVTSAGDKTNVLLWLTHLILRGHCCSFSDSTLLNPEQAAKDQYGRSFSADQSSTCTSPLFKDGSRGSESRKEQEKTKEQASGSFPLE